LEKLQYYRGVIRLTAGFRLALAGFKKIGLEGPRKEGAPSYYSSTTAERYFKGSKKEKGCVDTTSVTEVKKSPTAASS